MTGITTSDGRRPVVLQLIDSFNEGGSERQALQLTRLLHDTGRFTVRLASLDPAGPLRSTVADLPLGPVPSFPLTSFYDRNAAVQMLRLARFLKAEAVDVLHTHDFYTNVFGTLTAAVAGVPVRVASMRETGGMRSRTQLRVQRLAYSLASAVCANSEAVRAELLRQQVPAAKIAVIYNGIDTARVAPAGDTSRAASLARLGLPAALAAARFVTIVANMRHEVKDYPTFLRAARRARAAVPAAAFLLVGEGELTASLRRLADELGIADCTFFLGRRESVADPLHLADACVLSSSNEGFSNSILEYMAAGRPVVATDVGGAREAIEEGVTGSIVPPGDDEMMGERLVTLLREQDRASRMGEAGRRRVEQHFSCSAQVQRTASLYTRLLGGRA